ncbi:hypothetical protein ACLOJK_003188 [Asimina triloba]
MFGRDHAGGNEKLKQSVPGIKICGGSIDNVKGCTNKLENGDKLELGADSLPKPTRVFCGHEVNVSGICFLDLILLTPYHGTREYKDKGEALLSHQRQANLPTITSTIAEELETNPFMWVDLPGLQAKVGCHSPVEALKEIRQLKDNWRG